MRHVNVHVHTSNFTRRFLEIQYIDEFHLHFTGDHPGKTLKKGLEVCDIQSEWLRPRVAKGGRMMTQLR